MLIALLRLQCTSKYLAYLELTFSMVQGESEFSSNRNRNVEEF